MAARTKKAASDTILGVLKRGPQKGLTAVDISSKTELNLNTTRTVIWALTQAGSVKVVKRDEPTFGRPANRYALAA